jgi:acetyltransferase-like isoleucine patch superfamily enzyme
VIHIKAFVHPNSFIDDTVTIGRFSKIWQFATVIQGTRIGDSCNIGACATLTGPEIGNGVKISSGVVIGPGFKIADHVFIGPNVVLCNDLWPYADAEGFDVERLRTPGNYCVRIERGAGIGANSVILPGVTIGAGAIVAAGQRVTRNVPAGALYVDGELRQIPADWKQRRMRFTEEERIPA